VVFYSIRNGLLDPFLSMPDGYQRQLRGAYSAALGLPLVMGHYRVILTQDITIRVVFSERSKFYCDGMLFFTDRECPTVRSNWHFNRRH